MDIKKTVLEVFEELLGLEQDELLENSDMDLREAGLIDSVGIASMFVMIEEKLNCELDTKKLNFEDFTSINSIVNAIEKAVC